MTTSPSHPSKAAATRSRILETAASLFWRRSYHSVAMDELADATKVNKATIYRYFADKADLARAVTRLNGEQVEAGVFGPVFAEHSEPDERLAAIYRCMHARLVDLHREEGDVYGCPIAGLSLELGHEMPEIRRETAAVFERVEARMCEIASAAIDGEMVVGWSAETLGRTLTQILHGAFVASRLAADPAPFLDAGDASLLLIGSKIRLTAPSGELQ